MVPTNDFYRCILHGLQQLIDTGLETGPSRSLQHTLRADLVARGRDFMIANLQFDFNADEIAKSLGVRYRVLNYAFQDALGVSPYRYLLTEKMHAVRRELKNTDATIVEVCLTGSSTRADLPGSTNAYMVSYHHRQKTATVDDQRVRSSLGNDPAPFRTHFPAIWAITEQQVTRDTEAVAKRLECGPSHHASKLKSDCQVAPSISTI